jgi:hypothetical protein
MPLEGEISIETNGGTITVPVRAEVPVRPFPKGVYANDALAGARSPREVAVKAKEHTNEAAVLFEQGAVKAWYASNGWTYPVEGSQGSGKGAVQQFFEALGLAKPPRLQVDTTSLVLTAKAGSRVSRTVTLRTDENKPVYAQAASNQEWVTFGLIKYRGNSVSIPIEIAVPARVGETAHADVTILGNGKQHFVVPVSVTVEKEGAPPAHKSNSAVITRSGAQAAPRARAAPSWARSIAWFGAGFLVTTFVLLIGTLLVFIATQVLRRMN